MNEQVSFTINEKTKFIKHFFKFQQPTLSIHEQIVLLTFWEELFVDREEYEMAKVVKDEIDYIIKNPSKVPYKGKVVKQKIPFFKKIINYFKKWFNPKSKI